MSLPLGHSTCDCLETANACVAKTAIQTPCILLILSDIPIKVQTKTPRSNTRGTIKSLAHWKYELGTKRKEPKQRKKQRKKKRTKDFRISEVS